MSSTARNTIIGIVAVIVVIVLIFAFKGSENTALDNDNGVATTSVNTSGNSNGASNSTGKNNSGGTKTISGINIDSNEVLADVMKNELVRIPQTGVDVALTNGVGLYKEGSVEGSVNLGNIVGKVKTESGYDVFVQMAFTKKGSLGIQQYVALFSATSLGVKFTSAVLVGDRVTIQSVVGSEDPSTTGPHPSGSSAMSSLAGYIATINYLDRKNGEALTATPSVAKTLSTHVKSHIISK